MIQPVSAFSPRAVFRGSNKTQSEQSKKLYDSNVALINAGGVSLAAFGITTAIARIYTSSWANAGVLGLFGAFLSLFFMTPQLIESMNKDKKAETADVFIKKDSQKIAEAVKTIKPAKKLIQFRQQS